MLNSVPFLPLNAFNNYSLAMLNYPLDQIYLRNPFYCDVSINSVWGGAGTNLPSPLMTSTINWMQLRNSSSLSRGKDSFRATRIVNISISVLLAKWKVARKMYVLNVPREGNPTVFSIEVSIAQAVTLWPLGAGVNSSAKVSRKSFAGVASECWCQRNHLSNTLLFILEQAYLGNALPS